jgi:nicotinate-nucleotide adenylyltransferase
MPKNKQVGLFFGSFNPVHNGHLMIANWMAEFSGVDQVWFVVSPLNPFKQRQNLLADYHRIELVNRAINDYPRFKASAIETKLPKPSYTIDTLTYLSEQYPDFQFTLIMGSDQLRDFHRWKNSEEILGNYKLLVYPRPEESKTGTSERREVYPVSRIPHHDLLSHPSVTLVHAPQMEISSSFIRQSIKEGKDVRFFMPPQVWEYMQEMHFYE